MEKAAIQRQRECIVMFGILVLGFLSLIVPTALYAYGKTAVPGFMAPDDDLKRFKPVVESVIGEEIFNDGVNGTRYSIFGKRVNRNDAINVCTVSYSADLLTIDSADANKRVNSVVSRVAKQLARFGTAENYSLPLFWTSGSISSKNPGVIQWSGNKLTYLNASDDRLAVNGTNFTNFCCSNRILEEKLWSELENGNAPVILDVLLDYREYEGRKDPLGCWIVTNRTYNPEDEKHFICEGQFVQERIYPFDARYIAKRFSPLTGTAYKFYDGERPLIDARRICLEHKSRLAYFNSSQDEKDFESILWDLRERIFSPSNVTYTNKVNISKTIGLFTSGMVWFDEDLDMQSSWGRDSRFNDTGVSYAKFCNGEKDKAKNTYKKDKANSRHFAILKEYSLDGTSCWRLPPYKSVKSLDYRKYVVCRSQELSSMWRKFKDNTRQP